MRERERDRERGRERESRGDIIRDGRKKRVNLYRLILELCGFSNGTKKIPSFELRIVFGLLSPRW